MLCDVPGRYSIHDRPFSRGEILVRHSNRSLYVTGYFKSPQDTANAYTTDGWYRTGDVGLFDHNTLIGGRPTLRIIDRLRNALEIYLDGDSVWINPTKLEAVYGTALGVYEQQLILVSDRNECGIIAICAVTSNVNERDLMRQFKSLAATNDFTELEIPLDVILTPPWTIENSFLSPLGKAARGALSVTFKEAIDMKYAEHHTILTNSLRTSLGIDSDDEIDTENALAEIDRIISDFAKPNIPQNTNVSDFLSFQFTDLNLNVLLEQLKPLVVVIRNRSQIWNEEVRKKIKNGWRDFEEFILSLRDEYERIFHLLLSTHSPTAQLVTDSIHQFSLLKSKIIQRRHHLSLSLSTPHPEKHEVMKKYIELLDRLLLIAPQYGIRVPYQIWACGWWRRPGVEYSEEDDPTSLLAPLGSAEVYCQFTGEIIERDIGDLGRKRYHNLDRSEICRTIWAHEKITSVTKLFANDPILSSLWRSVDPYSKDVWVIDTAHQWHHRVVIDKQENYVDNPATIFMRSAHEYCHRLCLGMPSPSVFPDIRQSPLFSFLPYQEYDSYLWLTYQTISDCAQKIGNGILSLGCSDTPIAIAGYNTVEWMIVDFACALSHRTSIGIHTTNSPQTTQYIFNLSSVQILFCAFEFLKCDICDGICWSVDSIAEKCPTLRHIICMDRDKDQMIDIFNKQKEKFPNLEFHSFVDWIRCPVSHHLPDPSLIWNEGSGVSQKPFTILFTSGTTGSPKGVMVSVSGFLSDISERVFICPLITVSYIPLSHSSDRLKNWEFLCNGGRIGMAYYTHTNWIEHETNKKLNSALSVTNTATNVIGLFRQV
jgi:acyl-CoA synthetase (AMP-forming)/AMP-acid ligase II